MSERVMQRMLAPLKRGLSNLLARAVVSGIDSAGRMQLLQVRLLGSEVKADIEHLEPYGYTSCPHAGAEGLTVFLDGDRSHGLVIMVGDRRYRLQGLQGGEVALYTDEGDYLHFKRGRIAEINTGTLLVKASTKVRFETPLVETTGDLLDSAASNTRTVAGMRTVYNGHTNGAGTTTPTPSM
ncbi:MAG: phage baseplate assembly protein V [Pseudomonadota bacterium]